MWAELLEKILNQLFAMWPRPAPAQLQDVKLISHRGAHDKARGIAENTINAFDEALALGCWGIELDIQATADAILMVHHDPDLQRLWGHTESIASLTFSALRKKNPSIPTLEEVIARYGKKLHLFIELKVPFTGEAELFEQLQPLTPCKDYHLLSLDAELFKTFSAFPLPALLLVADLHNTQAFCTESIAKSYGGVLGHYLLLTDKKIQRLRKANQAVGVGFVDSTYSLYREVARGITWIFTNHTAVVSQRLIALRQKNKAP